MTIWTKTRARYEPKSKVNWNEDYALGLCKHCATLVIYKADGGAYCAKCGDTEAVKVLQSKITEYQEQFKQQLRIRDEMVSAIRPTINAMKSALISAGDGEIAHPVEEAMEIERASDILVAAFNALKDPFYHVSTDEDGSDTSMRGQLNDAGFGSGGIL